MKGRKLREFQTVDPTVSSGSKVGNKEVGDTTAVEYLYFGNFFSLACRIRM